MPIAAKRGDEGGDFATISDNELPHKSQLSGGTFFYDHVRDVWRKAGSDAGSDAGSETGDIFTDVLDVEAFFNGMLYSITDNPWAKSV